MYVPKHVLKFANIIRNRTGLPFSDSVVFARIFTKDFPQLLLEMKDFPIKPYGRIIVENGFFRFKPSQTWQRKMRKIITGDVSGKKVS